jgi:putative ABC transport system permease protein
MKYLRFIVRNLTRNRRRTILTTCSIAVSLFLMTFLLTVLAAFYQLDGGDTGHLRLITRHKVSLTNLLPESYWTKIRRIPGIVAVCPTSWFGGTYVDERNFFPQFAVDAASFLDLIEGEHEMLFPPEQAREWVRDRQGVLVSKKLADKYGWNLGDTFTLKGTIYPFNPELNVRAIFAGGDPVVYFHREYLEEGMGRPGVAGSYWIKVRSVEDLSRVARAVDAVFANSDAETLTESERAFQAGFLQMLGNVKSLMLYLTVVIAFSILMVVANTMAMSIRERATEVAVLKALGFGREIVLRVLLAEALVLTALGGAIGVGAYWGLAHLVFVAGGVRLPMVWFSLVPPAWLAAGAWVSTLGLGLSSGLIPAWGAARRSILDGLRQA